jgi:methyl-accepting chemotaxis protein
MGFFVVLFKILSYQSIQNMNIMGQQSEQINAYWVPILGIFGRLNGEVSEVERLVLRVILETKPSAIERLTAKLNTSIQTAATTLNTYKPLVSSDEQTEYDQSNSQSFLGTHSTCSCYNRRTISSDARNLGILGSFKSNCAGA